jgi:NAD(P)-dependent dehydrogenase (short-subunit alcohol dehydrogenase family)
VSIPNELVLDKGIGLTESAACEVATEGSMNIRVMTICPGEVDTKMQQILIQNTIERIKTRCFNHDKLQEKLQK